MDTDRVLTDQTVIVRGDTIASVVAASAAIIPAGATVIDCHGQYLGAGAHRHARPPARQ